MKRLARICTVGVLRAAGWLLAGVLTVIYGALCLLMWGVEEAAIKLERGLDLD